MEFDATFDIGPRVMPDVGGIAATVTTCCGLAATRRPERPLKLIGTVPRCSSCLSQTAQKYGRSATNQYQQNMTSTASVDG